MSALDDKNDNSPVLSWMAISNHLMHLRRCHSPAAASREIVSPPLESAADVSAALPRPIQPEHQQFACEMKVYLHQGFHSCSRETLHHRTLSYAFVEASCIAVPAGCALV